MARPKKAIVTKKKSRKQVEGPIRSIERTKEKLILAVAKIFSKKGYEGLTVSHIAETAGVDKSLIYTYFGLRDALIEQYINEKDFWDPFYNKYLAELLNANRPLGSEDIITILKGQLEAILYDREFQGAIHWEICQKTEVMRKVSDNREQLGRELFKLTEERFNNTEVDLQASLAVQIAGIYYLGLHAKINGSKFCGIDVYSSEGRLRIENYIKQHISDLYKKRKKRKI